MTLAPDGTVLAIATSTEKQRLDTFALRWSNSAEPEAFHPLSLAAGPGQAPWPFPEAIVAQSYGRIFIGVGQTFDGAYIHRSYEIQRWSGQAAKRWKVPHCAQYPDSGTHLLAMDDDSHMALTIDSSAQAPRIDINNLPVAVVVAHNKCTNLGRAVLTAVDGRYAAGYRGYIDSRQVAWFINGIAQRRFAVRWSGSKETGLEQGVPFAINRTGLTVGATALPGHAQEVAYGNFFGPPGKYEYAIPHAVAWLPNGKEIFLTRGDARSVAWDVNESGTIVGMEQMPDGKHYAFRFSHDKLERLDDLPHPAGWRFESAYAIGADGSIAGIGTYQGTPTAFVWRDTGH